MGSIAIVLWSRSTGHRVPQAAVGGGKPAPRPPHAALPYAGGPDEDGGHDTAHEAELLHGLDAPVDGAADAAAVLARGEEEGVAKAADPGGEQGEEEGVVPATGAQLEVLGA